MPYIKEIQQVENILSGNMTVYASSIDYGNIYDAEEPSGITGSNKMKCLVKTFQWGHDADTGTFWRVFEVVLKDCGATAETDENFESACKELLSVQEAYSQSDSTYPYSVNIRPLLIDEWDERQRTYRLIAYWQK